MSYKEDDNLADGLDEDLNVGDTSNENTEITLENSADIEESNEHDTEVRKRIDDLIEKKRLKELLDDSDDW